MFWCRPAIGRILIAPARQTIRDSDSVVLVDTGSYYSQQCDRRIHGIEADATESRWVAEQLGQPRLKRD